MAAASDGTVRGTFDLNVGPAVRGVREYRREAAAADVQTQQLGGTMDRTFGREQAAEINTVKKSMRELGVQTGKTRTVVRNEWIGMRRDVDREAKVMVTTIRGVKKEMRELGKMHASPTVDLDGIAEALAQVDLLEKRLNSLGRQRVTPRVAIGGGVAGGGRSGGGRVVGRGGGGRGGGNEALRSVGVGPFSLGSRAGLGFIAAGLPAVQAFTGAAVGLGGSLMGAGLGAGAVGLSSGGALAAGIATVVSVAKPAQTVLTDAMKAQQAYTAAVQDFGRKSKEAATAKREMDQAFGDEKGLRRATRQITGFGADWKRLTAPGRASYYGLLGDVAKQGRQVAPNLASFGNRSTAALRTSGSDFARFATNTENLGTLDIATAQFAKELPTVERTLENITLTAGRLYRASVPFFHDANEWVENWTGGWAKSAKDIDGTRDKMRGWVDEAKKWRDLTGSTFGLLRDIFRLGAPSGDSLVVSLTRTMDRWDSWVKSNPAQVKRFFSDTADSVRGMATALSNVVKWLNQMATLLRPLLDRFTQLVTLASQLGVLGAPGAFLALRGGLSGGKAALGLGAAAKAAGGIGRVGPAGVVGGVAAVGGAAALTRARALYGVTRELGAGRAAAGLAAGGGLLRGVGMGTLRGAGRAYAPLALGLSALDFATFNGGIAQKTQAALSTATLGVINAPPSRDALDDRAKGLVTRDLATLGGENTRKGMRANLARLTSFRQNIGGVDVDLGSGSERAQRIDSIRKTFSDEIKMRQQALHNLDRQQKQEANERARLKAARYAGGLQGAFQTYKGAGQDPTTALGSTLDQVQDKLKKTKDAGVKTLGEASLAWARAVAKGNPAMKSQVKDLTDSIRDRFKDMGQRVSIVNGNILTGTKTEWKSIRDAMTGATEQAREGTSSDFTAIQQQAIGSLKAMGFSPGQAQSLVKGMEQGGAQAKVAKAVTQSGPAGYGDPIPYQAGKKARGGMIGGRGLMDTVSIGGAMAAPGEAWIANRHTLADMSQATIEKFGLTAQQMIRGETRRHSQKYATGGLAPAEAGLVSRLSKLGFHPTSTTDGTHAPNSYHYRGMAADYGNSANNMPKLWSVLYPQRRRFAELFGPSSLKAPTLMHYGQGFSDPKLQSEHQDHIHVALTGGGGALGKLGRGMGGMGSVKLHGLGMQQAGIPGVLRNRAGDMYARGLQNKLNKRLSRMGGGGGSLAGFHGGGSSSANQKLGHRMMLAAGFGEDQWPSLQSLWTRESGWSNTARNPTSGAFGIPQSLPASKMGAKAVGGDPAAQIAWGLNYIKGRYGTPSAAMAHENSAGWYARGGRMAWGGGFANGGSMVTNGPTAFVAGEGSRRRERVTVTPANRPAGGDGVRVTIEKGAVVVHIEGGLKGGGDVEAMAAKVGEKVVLKVIEALDSGLGTVGA